MSDTGGFTARPSPAPRATSFAPRAMTDVDWDLVFRYFGDECSPEERDRFERWLAADAQRRVIVDAAVTAAGRALDAMPATMPARPPRVFTASTRRAGRPAWLLPVAASLVIALGGAVLMKYPGLSGSRVPRAASALRVAQTVRGGRQELRLADGTRVVLGPASTLRYPAEFGAGARDVELVGEGYFEVTHDAAHPFRVRAGHASAEDIGTAFGVRAYPEDSVVRVVVAEGSVALGAATAGAARPVPLMPGQLGSLARGEATPTVRQVNVAAHLGWLDDRLTFDETPLAEVVAQLGRWYDAPFRIADPMLASRTLTASFTTEPLADVLAALAPVLDVRFDRVADTVVVRAARH
jgi:transmembrane sensor